MRRLFTYTTGPIVAAKNASFVPCLVLLFTTTRRETRTHNSIFLGGLPRSQDTLYLYALSFVFRLALTPYASTVAVPPCPGFVTAPLLRKS